MELKFLRDRWEKGYEPVATFVSKEADTIHVVLNGLKPNTFALHRYFLLGKDWQVSVDAYNVSLLEIVKRLPAALQLNLDSLKIPTPVR